MNEELHISSLIVQHRPEAFAQLASTIQASQGMEIALRDNGRCVVLCETDDQRHLMDCIDALHTVPGVLTVSLIYHHAEPRAGLDEPVGGRQGADA